MTEHFKTYLVENSLKENTIKGHLQNVGYFLKWTAAKNLLKEKNIGYYDMLCYVKHERQEGKDVSTINLRLYSISKYFKFLKIEGVVSKNPAKNLWINGKSRTITQNPLDIEELEKLYKSYQFLQKSSIHPAKSELAHQRNIVIVGFLIWQGLHSGELERLKVEHVALDNGTIYIPSSARSNSRILKLSDQQIKSLHDYLNGGIRENLKPKADELLPGNLHNIVGSLIEELKGINSLIKNAQQIRSSVILHWLNLHDKRLVQYLIGHRNIGSVDKYEVQELQILKDQLIRYHPFR